MYINLCPETIGIHGLSPHQRLDLAAKHGFGGVDLCLDGISDVRQSKELRHDLEQRKLRWGLFWLPADFVHCSEPEYQPNLDKLRKMLPLVEAAGCSRTYLHVWPSADRPYAENLDHHVARLRPLATLLADHGVQLGLEFLGPSHMRREKAFPFIYRLPEMVELAGQIHPSVGVVIDMFHWHCGGGTVAELRRLLVAGQIVNIHANDARSGIPLDQQHNYQRELPLATGVIDAPDLMQALQEMDYPGPVIAEPFYPQLDRLAKLPADTAADEVIKIMRRLVAL
jgi:sugar phosphate isomerase/epimerase